MSQNSNWGYFGVEPLAGGFKDRKRRRRATINSNTLICYLWPEILFIFNCKLHSLHFHGGVIFTGIVTDKWFHLFCQWSSLFPAAQNITLF